MIPWPRDRRPPPGERRRPARGVEARAWGDASGRSTCGKGWMGSADEFWRRVSVQMQDGGMSTYWAPPMPRAQAAFTGQAAYDAAGRHCMRILTPFDARGGVDSAKVSGAAAAERELVMDAIEHNHHAQPLLRTLPSRAGHARSVASTGGRRVEAASCASTFGRACAPLATQREGLSSHSARAAAWCRRLPDPSAHVERFRQRNGAWRLASARPRSCPGCRCRAGRKSVPLLRLRPRPSAHASVLSCAELVRLQMETRLVTRRSQCMKS